VVSSLVCERARRLVISFRRRRDPQTLADAGHGKCRSEQSLQGSSISSYSHFQESQYSSELRAILFVSTFDIASIEVYRFFRVGCSPSKWA